MIRNGSGCSVDHMGTQHVRFVIARPSGRSLSKYDHLGCAVRVVLEYISDKRRLMLTEHQTFSRRSSHHSYGWLMGMQALNSKLS